MDNKLKSQTRNWHTKELTYTPDGLEIGGMQVMQYWERPLMNRLAELVTAGDGDVLEVGFGLGISAGAIMDCGCRSYTVIEAHPQVADTARRWGASYDTPVNVIEGYWQDVIGSLDTYDGILFDTYPLSEDERSRNHYPFIPIASSLLKPGGRFTYYSDETVDFRADHLSLLLRHFSRVELIKVDGLSMPSDCDYWQNDHMVIPVAYRGDAKPINGSDT